MSDLMISNGRAGLKENITLVPVGGLDKVTSFISLLRGQKLNIVCLLDTFTDQKGKIRLQDLIQQKIIKERQVRFFDEFTNPKMLVADLEDLFTKEEYLKLFNAAFAEYPEVAITELDVSKERIIEQINLFLKIKKFNHYRPANQMAKSGVSIEEFSEKTLDKFEGMFKEINKLF